MPFEPSRRSWLRTALAGIATTAAGVGISRARGGARAQEAGAHGGHGAAAGHDHALGTVGRVGPDRFFDPMTFIRSWNFSDLDPEARGRVYKETPRPDGTLLREYQFFAVDREIEIAPGIFYPAWTYNGQVPGPTIRATEGDRLRVTFTNMGAHPHTIHFHGWHPPEMDGSLPDQQVMPGRSFVYEFDADPAGLHLYHCHAVPLKRHIHKGLYGVFIVDRRDDPPGERDELVMVMNAFDTNFDNDNEVYAVNTVANAYMVEPIRVAVGRPVRIHLVNITEFDLINSFHLHGMFFEANRTGTMRSPEVTDTIMLCQGERAILDTTFRYPGDFMFHAHQSEFAELGWMGLFRAEDPRRDT
jgi:FtsP/CotA-like multicopper oxidase with cupredoxin domain